jgi:hypothetical protein
MKIIEIKRGKSPMKINLPNGDAYDSTLTIIDEGKEIFHTDKVNTDATNNYNGGELAEGVYYGIVGYRWNPKSNKWDGKRIIKLFQNSVNLKRIKDHTCLSVDDMTLPSKKPNPNHKNKKIIAYVQIHDGGWDWDWSHGCITILNTSLDFNKMMSLLEDNEIVAVKLV